MYDAHLQRTLACGRRGKTTDFRAKKGKVAFPRENTFEIEMLEGQNSFKTLEKRNLE